MVEKPWKTSVTLALEEPGTFTEISSTTEASWALIEDWPVEEGEALSRALDIFTAVFDGKRPAEDARAAFIAAAAEAGIEVKS